MGIGPKPETTCPQALPPLPPAQGAAREGFVVRCAGEIRLEDYGRMVGKYVRAGHVGEDAEHWAKGEWRKNGGK